MGMPPRQHAGAVPRDPEYPKATFYLPTVMLERLDKAWISRRNRDRRVKKSDLVREALDMYLAEQEQRRSKAAN
jgi:metal-responsive CopG/Arc/MetJ family transcriptional regulator